jgi:hypothetical protein
MNVKKSYDQVLEELKDKVIFVSERDRLDDYFRDPTGLFILNAMGEAVYFRTRDRKKAQEWSNMLYGDGFYVVKKSLKAQIR